MLLASMVVSSCRSRETSSLPPRLPSETGVSKESASWTAPEILRMVNSAQATYAGRYPETGYASSLYALGPHNAPDCSHPDPPATFEHACLIADMQLANHRCTGENWCGKNGYSFRVWCSDNEKPCREYVVMAVPVEHEKDSYCSTSDSVVRLGRPDYLAAPMPTITADECRAWRAIE